MDRVSPQLRPNGRPVGRQSWRHLLFVHWPVPVETLRPLVPARLELDLLHGAAYVGIVPFAMCQVRPAFFPETLGLNFLETNVRTYVHLDGVPGVYFFSLEASSRIAVRVARAQFGLPYHDAKMSMSVGPSHIDYSSRRLDKSNASFQCSWELGEPLGPSPAGSDEHFLLERYYLFVDRRGVLLRGQVHHMPYPARRAHVRSVDETLLAAAGMPPSGAPPSFVHYADGVDVEVFAPTRV